MIKKINCDMTNGDYLEIESNEKNKRVYITASSFEGVALNKEKVEELIINLQTMVGELND